ncbi:MAG TPA: phosphoribosylglycinamide formyltransferase [Steroidobacteraceae bacterium]|nr:phosphoribosylglycinamide formyltransferase [Steroidobacteraceae bacterium]
MTAPARLPVVVLLSGRGSNLRALAERAATGHLPIEIRAVVSDRPESAGLAWAGSRGLPTAALRPADYPDRESYDRALGELVESFGPRLVVLAGFMRILGAVFVDRFAGRMLNIHPSLLPRHRGLHTHRRVLEAGEREHGASVHFVTRELDGGPVVIQARVPVLEGDDEDRLAARVLEQEHRIYPRCVGWFATGRLQYRDGAAWLDGRPLEAPLQMETLDAEDQTVAT